MREMGPQAPCKDCKERKAPTPTEDGCHTYCERYLKFTKERNEYLDELQFQKRVGMMNYCREKDLVDKKKATEKLNRNRKVYYMK